MIYVDTLRPDGWCHMMADSLSDLHEMARRLGLRRWMFQSHARHPHYDLRPYKRAEAIRLGATPVSSREMLRLLRDPIAAMEQAAAIAWGTPGVGDAEVEPSPFGEEHVRWIGGRR